MTYTITTAAGVYLGRYDGHTEAEALDAMHRAAGYDNGSDAARRLRFSIHTMQSSFVVREASR